MGERPCAQQLVLWPQGELHVHSYTACLVSLWSHAWALDVLSCSPCGQNSCCSNSSMPTETILFVPTADLTACLTRSMRSLSCCRCCPSQQWLPGSQPPLSGARRWPPSQCSRCWCGTASRCLMLHASSSMLRSCISCSRNPPKRTVGRRRASYQPWQSLQPGEVCWGRWCCMWRVRWCRHPSRCLGCTTGHSSRWRLCMWLRAWHTSTGGSGTSHLGASWRGRRDMGCTGGGTTQAAQRKPRLKLLDGADVHASAAVEPDCSISRAAAICCAILNRVLDCFPPVFMRKISRWQGVEAAVLPQLCFPAATAACGWPTSVMPKTYVCYARAEDGRK